MKHMLFLAALGSAATLSASLIPIGAVPSSGTGLGAVNTILTIKTANGQTTFESGCVGADAGGNPQTGAAFCGGTSTGGDEQPGGSKNNVYLASSILTGGQNFSNLQIIFNASEPQNASSPSISLTDLTLTLWSGGSIAGQFSLDPASSPYTPTAFPGTGNAGYGFVLDATQAAAANALGPLSSLYIGLSATATGASGGLDTAFIRSFGTGPGPEPGPIPEPSTYVLLGSALLGLAMYGRRRRA